MKLILVNSTDKSNLLKLLESKYVITRPTKPSLNDDTFYIVDTKNKEELAN